MTPATTTRHGGAPAHAAHPLRTERAGRPPAVPRQRADNKAEPSAWDGYSNAGPDVYWPLDKDRPALS